ncbi:SpoIIE family protein phosphatase [Nocardioides sp. 1609]|uniref:SpoIIE family protein phosphatase n=1 Tax=Nocardioides sp. 1609 TaxID=2508327 RepID=UPI00106F2144|nr:SpoIIE family protein phosphatase [Nocardioides sp. 1609]
MGNEPSAVLLVDLSTRDVVHANPVARQLAPGLPLPSPLDAWSDTAGLRDLDGGLLSETDHPLSRLARTEPVNGQAVSARRGSDMGQQRQPLWVVALPMLDSPLLNSYALVVMLPIGRRADVPQAASLDLHSRAVVATGLSFTLVDATDPDLPLVWVNPAFTATTGYTLEESVGRNCRFLQGTGTDPAHVDRIRQAVRAGEDVTCTVLNYRKDATAYWNQVHISPVHGPDGALTHFVGILSDVTGRIEADRARDAALLAERRARAASEAAEERLQLLVDASSGLVGAADVADSHRRLIDLLVPRVADFALVLGPTGTDDLGVLAAQHTTEELVGDLRDVAGGLAAALVAGSPVDVLVGADGGRLLTDLDTPAGSDARRDYIADEQYLAASAAFPVRSAVLVPLPGRGPATEVLVLGRSPGRPQFTRDDVEVAADLGRRVGVLVENTRLHELQRSNSEVLQRSLLPDLPTIRGIRSAAQYHAGAVGSQVGGDFYDLTTLADGTVALAVGDVVGHDIVAAAAMGQLRGLLRACVHDPAATPSSVIARVERLLTDLQLRTIASMLQAFLTRTPDGWDLVWSCAGHPPLAVRYPDGRVELLGQTDGNDPLIGVGHPDRHEESATLPVGTLLLGYTDGLVERRTESLDLGLQRLLHHVRVGPADPAGLVEHLVEHLTRGSDHDDDIALVAVRLD